MFSTFTPTIMAALLALSAGEAAAQDPVKVSAPQRMTFDLSFKFPPKAERAPLPFQIVNGLLVFRARVNGVIVWAVLDNAMGMSVIDKQFAANEGIVVGPPIGDLKTPSGSLERRMALDVPIELPRQISWKAPLSVVDLSFLTKATGRPISLVIGKEYFGLLTFVVLTSRGTFEVGPSGALKLPANTPFATIEDDQARVPVEVGGRNLSLLIDLGATGQVLLNPTAWSRLGLDKVPQRPGRAAHLDGNILNVALVDVPRVSIGPFTLNKVVVQSRPALRRDADGFVGLGFLRNFDFAMDVKGRRLWLLAPRSPASGTVTAP